MFINFFNRLEEFLLALFLVAMTLITFSQVVARYLFNAGAVWALELTMYLFAWMILLGISYGVRIGAHIGVDAVVRILSSAWQRWLAIVTAWISIVYGALFLLGGSQYVYKIYQTGWQSIDLPISQWIPYSILPIGMALLCLRFAQVLVKIQKGVKVQILADEAREVIEEFDQSTPKPGVNPL
jgi:C4-dicarboxylate transporter DctQ subunit